MVAPFAGAWIEMLQGQQKGSNMIVAPFAGAWIEMCNHSEEGRKYLSLPSRERGLKSRKRRGRIYRQGRSLRGSVD